MIRPIRQLSHLLTCALGLGVLSLPASAEVFCVDNATAIQDALL